MYKFTPMEKFVLLFSPAGPAFLLLVLVYKLLPDSPTYKPAK